MNIRADFPPGEYNNPFINKLEAFHSELDQLIQKSTTGTLLTKEENAHIQQEHKSLNSKELKILDPSESVLLKSVNELFCNLILEDSINQLHQIPSDFKPQPSEIAPIIGSNDDLTLSIHQTKVQLEARLNSAIPLTEKEIHQFHESLFGKLGIETISQIPDLNENPCLFIKKLRDALVLMKTEPQARKGTGNVEGGFAGASGSYFLSSRKDGLLVKEFIWKPQNEEASPYAGVVNGESVVREHLGFLFNSEHTPYTAMVNIDGQLGSLQQFVKNSSDLLLKSLGAERDQILTKLDSYSIQASLLYDMRFNNLDRHLGNLVVDKQSGRVWTIDNGCSMPANRGEAPKYEQLIFPQMDEEIDERLIQSLQNLKQSGKLVEQSDKMREHGIGEETIARSENATDLILFAIEQSLMSKASGGRSITMRDLGFLFLKGDSFIWDKKNLPLLKEFIQEIIQMKNAPSVKLKEGGALIPQLMREGRRCCPYASGLEREALKTILILDPESIMAHDYQIRNARENTASFQ